MLFTEGCKDRMNSHMRGSRKICQRGSKFDNVSFLVDKRILDINTAINGPSSACQRNAISTINKIIWLPPLDPSEPRPINGQVKATPDSQKNLNVIFDENLKICVIHGKVTLNCQKNGTEIES